MIDRADFPNLTDDNHRVTSPASPHYNCVAWAAEDTSRWWEPSVYWPITGETHFDRGALERGFAALGFQVDADPALEANVQKIALYADGEFYTHVARQLATGKWTSKLGRMEDIKHNAPEDIAGGVYGSVVAFMKRKR